MSSRTRGTPFRTLAAGLFDPTQGGAPITIAEMGLPTIVRTLGFVVGSYDIAFANPNPAPTNKVVVNLTPNPAGAATPIPAFAWVINVLTGATTLRVSFRDGTAGGASIDAVFGVEVNRIAA